MRADRLTKNVEKALDEIRPFLKNDDGDVTLLRIENDVAYLRLEGNCYSCKINKLTLKTAIEVTIKKHVPSIKEIINVL